MTLGEKLQRLRKEKKLSQEQLASQMNVSRQAISKWELGESIPDTEHVITLSHFFGVTLDYLLKEEVLINDCCELKTSPPNHNNSVRSISVGVMVIGLLLSIVLWTTFQSWILTSVGIMIQIIAFIYFMVKRQFMSEKDGRMVYMIGTWLVLPFPIKYLVDSLMVLYPRPRLAIFDFGLIIVVYFLIGGVITISLNRKKGTE